MIDFPGLTFLIANLSFFPIDPRVILGFVSQ